MGEGCCGCLGASENIVDFIFEFVAGYFLPGPPVMPGCNSLLLPEEPPGLGELLPELLPVGLFPEEPGGLEVPGWLELPGGFKEPEVPDWLEPPGGFEVPGGLEPPPIEPPPIEPPFGLPVVTLPFVGPPVVLPAMGELPPGPEVFPPGAEPVFILPLLFGFPLPPVFVWGAALDTPLMLFVSFRHKPSLSNV